MYRQVLIDGLLTGSLFGLCALSIAIPFWVSRFFNFAHASVIAWGAYLTLALSTLTGLGFGVAWALAIAGCMLLGAMIDLGVYGPLRRRGSKALILMIASLGLHTVLLNLISLTFGDRTQTFQRGEEVGSIVLAGAHVTTGRLVSFALSCTVMGVGWLLIRRTSFGKALQAVASDAELAQIHGIDINRVRRASSALGAGLAGLTGVLFALDTDMVPTMGLSIMMMGVVAMFVGGVRSVPGLLGGGLTIGLIKHLGTWWLGDQWQDAISFTVLVALMVLGPNRIYGNHYRATRT